MLGTVNFQRIHAFVRSDYFNKLKEHEKTDLVSCIWILIARLNERTVSEAFTVGNNNVKVDANAADDMCK